MTGSLDIEVTYAAILAAARNGEVTSYRKIAQAHGRDLDEVDRGLFRHLGNILRVCFKRGWPALTVVVVNEETGAMTGMDFLGFAAAAQSAGYKFDNARMFVRIQSDLVFRWVPYAPEKLEPKDKEIRRLPIRTVGYKNEWKPFRVGVA